MFAVIPRLFFLKKTHFVVRHS